MPQIRPIGVSGSIPTVNQLALGDIALNTYDGKAYIKKAVANTQTIIELGVGSGVTQIVAGTNVTISPVGGIGVVTINSTTGSGTPPNGPNYSLQYNNGGLFSGSGNFTLLNNNQLFLPYFLRIQLHSISVSKLSRPASTTSYFLNPDSNALHIKSNTSFSLYILSDCHLAPSINPAFL